MDKLVAFLGLMVTSLAADVRQITNPFIIEHPEHQYVVRNEPAKLNCKAEGQPSPIITWYRNGQPVVTANEDPTVDRMQLPSGQLFFFRFLAPGKAGRSASAASDVGVYYCNATNPETGLSVVSRNASLDVAVMRDEFREEPADVELAAGHTATLRCRPPRAEPEPRVAWKKDGVELAPDGDRIYVDRFGSLHVMDARRDDTGQYACVAENIAGQRQSAPAQLTVREKPRIVESPKDIIAKENSNVIFHCRATGDPEPTVIWKKLNGQIAAERSFIMADRMLQIERVQISDEGTYVCRVENSVGWREAEAKLVVHSPPSFVVTPRDKQVGVNRQVAFRCQVTGNPIPAVFWNRESSETYMFPNQDHGHLSVLEDGTLLVTSVRTDDCGVYLCKGLSIAGTAVAKVRLDVQEVDTRLPPVIVSGPQNQTLPLGGVASLLCVVDGQPTPEVYWFKNDRVLPSVGRDPRLVLVDSGTLQISDLRRSDTGDYECWAASETGLTRSHAARLSVDAPSSGAVVFHRSPKPNTFPASPGRPSVGDVTNTSVQLAWRVPGNVGTSPLIGYTVEYFSHVVGQSWTQAADVSSEPTCLVRNLRPNTPYVFVVRARNSHGLSGPSNPSKLVTTKGEDVVRSTVPTTVAARLAVVPTDSLSGVIVGSLSASAVSSTAIRLSWQLLQPHRQVVEGFRIKYRSLNDAGDDDVVDYLVKTVRPGDVMQFLLTGLQPYTWYDVYVQPFRGNVDGASSTIVRQRTSEDVPSASPSAVHAVMVDNSTLKLSWKPPPHHAHNGPLLGYRVYIYNNATRLSQEIEVNSTVESVVVYHLAKHTRFTVKVAAFNRAGEGVRSDAEVAVSEAVVDRARREVVDEPWFLVVLVGVVVGLLAIMSCVIVAILYQRHVSLAGKSSKQPVLDGSILKFEHNVRLCGRPSLPAKSSTAQHAANSVQSQTSPRCYSNESRGTDGESPASFHDNDPRSADGHYYYSLQTCQSADDNEDDIDNDMEVFNDCDEQVPVVRPIPQSYMIRPPTDTRPFPADTAISLALPPSSGDAGRRYGSLSRRPVLFLPPPPPCDDLPQLGLHRVIDAMTSCPSDTGGVKGYSAMRPYPISGHQLRPDNHWSSVVDAYYNGSDTEDTGAATWNSLADADIDDSNCPSQTTDDDAHDADDDDDGMSSGGSLELDQCPARNAPDITHNVHRPPQQPASLRSLQTHPDVYGRQKFNHAASAPFRSTGSRATVGGFPTSAINA